jgi:hypothetical protein
VYFEGRKDCKCAYAPGSVFRAYSNEQMRVWAGLLCRWFPGGGLVTGGAFYCCCLGVCKGVGGEASWKASVSGGACEPVVVEEGGVVLLELVARGRGG